VSRLARTQMLFRNALVTGNPESIAPLLAGGRDPARRFAVHRRNYETSLVTALLTKFPASVWLVGSTYFTEAATLFVKEHPPQEPCIAEYGEAFPSFVQASPAGARLPYLGEFAQLEWYVGQASIATEDRFLTFKELSIVDAALLPETTLIPQSGVHYLQVCWPVDDLLTLYLTNAAPDRYAFEPAVLWLEIRGARGEFRINRLRQSEFIFRKSIFQGRSIGEAAEAAFEADSTADPGAALIGLVAAGLATGIKRQGEE
jgi:putative DNA-binding protein